MDEPVLRAYILDAHRPATFFEEHPGHWVAEPAWPSEHATAVLHLGDERLSETPDEVGARCSRSPGYRPPVVPRELGVPTPGPRS